jgi:hypothetical protein
MIPHEKTMVEKLKNRPFALLGINSDEDRDVLKELQNAKPPLDEKARAARIHEANLACLGKILKEQGISWRQAAQESTEGPIPTRWNVRGWPTIYVVDASGKIRFKDLRDQALEDAVVKLLDEMPK